MYLLSVLSARAQFSGAGSGASNNPYQITNADELAEMANFLGEKRKGTCFKLMNDIDLTNWIVEKGQDEGWIPLGSSSSPFMGNFDGNGYSIKGMVINRPDMDNVGFWGFIWNASISNLIIKESSITARQNVGGIAGHSYSSTITNCTYSGEVCGSSNNIGGIIGYSQLPTTCISCKHYGSINGNNNIGGIIGNLEGTSTQSKDASVSSCCNYGNIVGLQNTGGIIGRSFLENHSTYTEMAGHYFHSVSNHATTICQCVSIGNVNGTNYVGGLLGAEETDSTTGASHVDITECYAKGAISGTNSVGGIAGIKYVRGVISNCYSNVSINGTSKLGGIAGEIHNSTISSSCAIVTTISGTDNFGRICGYNKGSSVLKQSNLALSECIIESDENIIPTEDDDLNGTGVSLDVFQLSGTYSELGWNLTDIWTINNGLSFPYLAWEKKVNQIKLGEETIDLLIGETMEIIADVNPIDADYSDIDWISSDSTIAMVQNGVVTAISEGSASITVISKDGSNIQASCSVTVREDEKDSDSDNFENLVYMENFSADAGDVIDVPILMKNKTADEIANFDFYLQLPEGISVVLDEEKYPVINISTQRTTARKHAIFGDIENDGKIHIYSSASRNTYFFSGTEGEVAIIPLKVADNAADGIYHIVIRDVTMNRISSEETYSIARFNLSASIGDVSIVKTFADGESYSATEDDFADKLIYNRTFSSSGKWQALYVPFSIPFDTLTKYGLEVAELNNVHMYDTDGDKHFDKTTMEFLYLTSDSTQANYPYLIRANESVTVSLMLKNTVVKAATETQIECATTRQTFKIKGTYTGVSGAEMYNNNYYAMGGGGLVRVEDATSGLKPQRWYLSIENKDGSPVDYYAPKMRIMINGVEIEEEDETTGIHNISTSSENETLYTLDGREINTSKTLPSGIYIKNHQKMIVR